MIANAMHPGKLEILNLGQPQCGKNRTFSLIETAELTNPNFPDTFNAGTKCIWKIVRPLGFQLTISFPKYNVSNQSESQYKIDNFSVNNLFVKSIFKKVNLSFEKYFVKSIYSDMYL